MQSVATTRGYRSQGYPSPIFCESLFSETYSALISQIYENTWLKFQNMGLTRE